MKNLKKFRLTENVNYTEKGTMLYTDGRQWIVEVDFSDTAALTVINRDETRPRKTILTWHYSPIFDNFMEEVKD